MAVENENRETLGLPDASEFEAFDRFPWSKSRAFLLGLIETLGGVAALAPSPTHEGSAVFCRTVFFRRQAGRRIDLTRYHSFRAAQPDYPSIDRRLLAALYAAAEATGEAAAAANGPLDSSSSSSPLSPETAATRSRRIVDAIAAGPAINVFDGTPTPPLVSPVSPVAATDGNDDSVPSWQRNAPKNELQLPVSSGPGAGGLGGGGSNGTVSDEAPYSERFAAVIEAIQTGKPLEGIRQIPDTVVRQEGITPLGKLRAPKKPWEMKATAAGNVPLAGITDSPAFVDLEFPPPPSPPAEEDASSASVEEASKEMPSAA